MRLKKIVILSVYVCLSITTIQSQTITLNEIQTLAEANYPAVAKYNIIEKTKAYSIANANKAFLPQGTLSTQASWQSDVTHIEMDLPSGMPPIDLPIPDKDQYRVVAEVNQIIWDGGNISSQKKSITANAELENKKLDSEVYALRERVNNLYFGILLIKSNLKQHEILEKELKRNYNNVESYVANGLANQADLSVVKVEQLKAQQQYIQLESTLDAYIQMLSVIVGQPLSKEMDFVKPSAGNELISPIINRPELQIFAAQEQVIDAQNMMLKAKNRPKLLAFAQGGVGKPGLNMFENQFSPYFLGGIRLSWNIGNLYTYGNDKKKIELQKAMVKTQKETFEYGLYIQVPQQLTEIEKYKKTMQSDNEIIHHQKMIREAAEVKVENGTMTVSDLMKEINSEEAAMRAKTLHEIQYLLSIYSLKHTLNQ